VKVNGTVYVDTVRTTRDALEIERWLAMSQEERDELVELARNQYSAERDRMGDPPYDIGNGWLYNLEKHFKSLEID
jgi:hypothetical protein